METTVVVIPQAFSQAQFDTKFLTTTKNLKDLGGVDSKDTDDLPEGSGNRYDTGVPPADTDDLPEGDKKFVTVAQIANFITSVMKANLPTNDALIIALEKLDTAPETPTEGRIYYDTVMTKVRLYKNEAWHDGALAADEII